MLMIATFNGFWYFGTAGWSNSQWKPRHSNPKRVMRQRADSDRSMKILCWPMGHVSYMGGEQSPAGISIATPSVKDLNSLASWCRQWCWPWGLVRRRWTAWPNPRSSSSPPTRTIIVDVNLVFLTLSTSLMSLQTRLSFLLLTFWSWLEIFTCRDSQVIWAGLATTSIGSWLSRLLLDMNASTSSGCLSTWYSHAPLIW